MKPEKIITKLSSWIKHTMPLIWMAISILLSVLHKENHKIVIGIILIIHLFFLVYLSYKLIPSLSKSILVKKSLVGLVFLIGSLGAFLFVFDTTEIFFIYIFSFYWFVVCFLVFMILKYLYYSRVKKTTEQMFPKLIENILFFVIIIWMISIVIIIIDNPNIFYIGV